MDAHLLFDPGADHIVRLAQAAVVVHPDLGHDEKGDPGGARRCAFDAGQHRVNDVLGQVVFARGDKDLVAGDGVCAVRVPHGRRGEGAHVGAGLRLGQEHGAGPAPGVHIFEKKALLFFGAEAFNQFAGAVGEPGVHDKGEVGPVQVTGGRQGHAARHALPAPLGVFGHRQPLAFLEGFPRLVEGCGHGHPAAVEVGPLAVAVHLGGQNLLYGEVAGLGDDKVDRLAVELSKALVLRQFLHLQLLVQDEIDVPSIRNDLGHNSSLKFVRWSRRLYR